MTEEQFKAAAKLRNERQTINKELKIWMDELTQPAKLGYLQGWNNNHATKLETNIPVDIFMGFRTAAMNALELRLVQIESELAEV